jgi:hypothetical protein
MKLQRTTLVLMLVALILAIGVYFLEIQRASQPSNNQANQQKLFDFNESEIIGLSISAVIDNKPQVISLVRGDQKTSLWQMQHPENSPANDAVVDFLVGLLVETRTNPPLVITDNQFIEYGLNLPLATIEIKLQNQQTFQLILGKQTFDKNSLYAVKEIGKNGNSQASPKQVFLVPLNFQNAVDRPLSEWKKL